MQLSTKYAQIVGHYISFNMVVKTGQSINFDFFMLTENVIVCLLIPIFNNLLLPFNPGLSMKPRLGVGVFFLVLSIIASIILQLSVMTEKHLFLLLLLPIALFAVADMLIVVTGICINQCFLLLYIN